MSSESWAWAAGFFDGEGHISCRDRTGRGHLEKYRSPRTLTVAISQHHREVLEKFQVIVGCGTIYELTKTRPARSKLTGQYQSYSWRTGKRGDALKVVEGMWPWLGSIKRLQAASSLMLHTSLDPKHTDTLPNYLVNYYNDRAGEDFQKGVL